MDIINKSDVPPVLLRYYADSGSPLKLQEYVEHHYKLYRESLAPTAKFLSLSAWMKTYLASSHRKEAPTPHVEVNHGEDAH